VKYIQVYYLTVKSWQL